MFLTKESAGLLKNRIKFLVFIFLIKWHFNLLYLLPVTCFQTIVLMVRLQIHKTMRMDNQAATLE
jgi:hypothetical protein